MNTYIAILRGINVGGKKTIRMADLQAQLGESGLKNVTTYIQSGNVIFTAESVPSEELARQIEAIILKHFGFQVPVIVLTVDELSAILLNNPFVNDGHDRYNDIGSLHVTFLSERPDQDNIENAIGMSDSPNEWRIDGRAVYFFCPHGYSKTKFTNDFFEKKLQVTATTRNWKTASTLLKIANGS